MIIFAYETKYQKIMAMGLNYLTRTKCMNDTFIAILTTRGRVTGKEHSVMLKAVGYEGKIYFSRHKLDGDWLKNAQSNPKVSIKYDNQILSGHAILVKDIMLEKQISELKYPGEARAKEKRIVLQVTLD